MSKHPKPSLMTHLTHDRKPPGGPNCPHGVEEFPPETRESKRELRRFLRELQEDHMGPDGEIYGHRD